MFLKNATVVVAVVLWQFFSFTTAVRADETPKVPSRLVPEVTFRQTTQVGYDYWDLWPSVATGGDNTRFFLANSTPQWDYSNLSAWMNFNGEVRTSTNTTFTMKFRADQSSAFRLDELSADYAISPFLGFRAGVLDYKTSWCRRYEVDSPWVRENDPFCTVRSTERAIGAAPGVQIYARTSVGSYQAQAVAGVFRPMAFDYDKAEFTNFRVDSTTYSAVQFNRKMSLALNAVNVDTGTEFRFSWQGTDQGARATPPDELHYQYHQKVNLFYAGVSLLLADRLTFRTTYLKSTAKTAKLLTQEDINQTYPLHANSIFNIRTSQTLELNYQVRHSDIVSFAASSYKFNSGSDGYRYDPYPAISTDLERTRFKNNSYSLSWRRDWSAGLFTAIQWTHARTKLILTPPYDGENFKGHANALGFRLGYRF